MIPLKDPQIYCRWCLNASVNTFKKQKWISSFIKYLEQVKKLKDLGIGPSLQNGT